MSIHITANYMAESSHLLGHFGCFCVLTILHSAAVNIEVHVSYPVSLFLFFPDIYPGVEFLDHTVFLFLVF